jgi:hypothetical protein
MNWASIWTFFFFLSLALFTCLAIVVTIGGFFNIRSLFRDLGKAEDEVQDDSQADS